MPISSSRLSLIQLHISVLLAGGAGLFAKFVETSPAVITCGRTLFGSAALALVAFLIQSDLRVRCRKDLIMLALSGAILAMHWFSFFVAIRVSTVAIGLLAFSSFPLFVAFLEPLIFQEKLRGQDLITVVLVVLGLILVTPSWDLSHHLTQGVLWGGASAFTYALLSLMSRWYVRLYPTVTVAFYQQAFAALCSLPLALCWQGSISGRDLGLLVTLGVIFTGLAQWLAVASLRYLRAQTVGVAYGMEPVYGVIFAWLLLQELPSVRTLCGGALICSSVLWTAFKERSAPKKSLQESAGN
jgi:drug/metabolite transporter (DMT)-like permease